MAYSAGSATLKLQVDNSGVKEGVEEAKKAINSLKMEVRELSEAFKSIKMNATMDQINDAKKLAQAYKSVSREAQRAATSIKNVNSAGTRTTNPIKTNTQGVTRTRGLPETLRTQLAAENQNVFNDLSKGLSKAGKIAVGISVVIATIQTSINTSNKVLKATYQILGNSVKYFTEMNLKAGQMILKFSGLQTVFNGIGSVVSTLKNKITEAFSIDNIETFIKECTELGSALTEVQNVIDVIFGEYKTKISDWASTLTSAYGLSELSAKQYSSTLGAMFNASGLSAETTETMSKNLTELTADMASFFNLDYDTAFQKIQSGLSGQVKPLLSLGVSLHAATLQEYMNKEGIDATYNSLDYASKQLIRYNYLVEATTKAQGDFARTFWNMANQGRLLVQTFSQIKSTLGQAFVNMITPIAIMLNVVLTQLQAIATAFSNFVTSIFGDSTSAAQQAATDYSDMLEDMASNTDETAKDIKKSLDRTVMSFDELHKLDKKDSSDSSSGSDLLGSIELKDINTIDVPDVSQNKWYQYMTDLIAEIKEAWKNTDFTDLGKKLGDGINYINSILNSKWSSIHETAKKIGTSAATFLNGLVTETDFTLIGTNIQNTARTILYTIDDFVNSLDPTIYGQKFAYFINGIFSPNENGITILEQAGTTIADTINKLATNIKTAAEGIDFIQLGESISNGINNLFSGIDWSEVGNTAGEVSRNVLNTLNVAFQNLDWTQIGKSINDFIKNMFNEDENGNTFLDIAGDMAVNFINGLTTSLKEVLSGDGLEKARKEISEFFKNIKDNLNWYDISQIINEVMNIIWEVKDEAIASVDWFAIGLQIIVYLSHAISEGTTYLLIAIGVIIASVITAIALTIGSLLAEAIIGLIENVVGLFSTLKEGLIAIKDWLVNGASELFAKILTWLTDTVSKIIEGITKFGSDVATKASEIWENIKSAFSSVATWFGEIFDSAVTKIKEVFNPIKDFFKGIWDFIKDLFSGVGDWFKDKFQSAADGIKGAFDSVKGWFSGDSNISVQTTQATQSSFNPSVLPHLAGGGYVEANMPQLAVIGDNTSYGEIVTPENKMFEVMTNAMAAFFGGDFLSALGQTISNSVQGNRGTGNIIVPVSFDGTEIARLVLTQSDIENARGGRF